MGTASLEVVTGGTSLGVGSSYYAATASTAYTLSAWVKGEAGKSVRLDVYEQPDGLTLSGADVVMTGSWQRLSITKTTKSNTTTIGFAVVNRTAAAHTFYVDAAMIELSSTLGDYFDGSFNPAGDFSYSWTGTANASTSIARGATLSTVTGGSASAIQSSEWQLTGAKSLRVIPSSTVTDNFASPGGDAGAMRLGMVAGNTYTVSATIRLSAPLTGTLTPDSRKIVLFYKNAAGAYINNASTQAPNTAGTTRLSVTVSIPAGATEAFIRLYNGASAGNGDVWWDAVMLEASPIVQDYFDGSVVSADADLTNSWSGTAHASTSVMRGVGLSTVSYFNAVAIQSSAWASTGTKSVRVIPTATPSASAGLFTVPTTVGQTYTVKGVVRLAATQTGVISGPRIAAYNAAISSELGVSAALPNVAGVTSLSFTFVATTTTSNIIFYNGTNAGGGDVWFDDFMVVAGTYTDSYFDGSTADTFRKVFYWTGTENASTSIAKQSEYIYFSDDDTGIPYTGATVSYGTELLYNQITVTYPAGTALANNTSSQSSYGIISTDIDSVLSNSSQATTLADYLANKYGQPEYRFEAIQINLLGISGDQANSILQTELGDIATIRFTPNGVGSPIERVCIITSIKQSIGIDSHIVSLGFTSIPFSSLVLDDYGFGILDVNTLSI